MFKRIVVATDSLDTCDAPSLVASSLAKQGKAKLYIMHVLESSDLIRRQWVKDFRTGEEIAATEEYIKTVEKTMRQRCAKNLIGLKDYVIEVRPGFPWLEVLRTARKAKADLIVLGPHRGKAEERGVVRRLDRVGTTAEAVIMRAHCPVMLVSREVPEERLAFKKVLFCTDFSETCQYAFELSLKVARKYGSKLYLFHVLRIPRGEQIAYTPEQMGREIAEAKEKMQKTYGGQIKKIDASFDVWEGLPPAEIQKYAASNDVDLIIMGSHVREQEERWYLGSVVERLGLQSYCPVITVTRPEALLKIEG